MRIYFAVMLAVVWSVAKAQFDPEFGKFKDGSKGTLPSLTFSIPFNGAGMKEELAPIRQACINLNQGFGRSVPNWRWRECALVKYLTTPKTLVDVPDNDWFTHYYTPPKVGKETLRFVIEFDDKHIDVHCVLHAKPYEH